MPHLVRERLFFGDIEDAATVLRGGGDGDFSHVLSVLSSASISFFSDWRKDVVIPNAEISRTVVSSGDSPRRALPAGRLLYTLERAGPGLQIQRMAVAVRDTEDENLLDFLEVCLDFIDVGRKEGSVLVHCFAGVSRSASVVTAYIMRTEQKSLEAALESVAESCEFICPNDGFLDQLRMFEEMGFKVDTASPIYKRFRLKVLGHWYKIGEKLDDSIFEEDPTEEFQGRKTAYRCKKCRRLIFLQDNVVSHVPGERESSLDWNRRSCSRQLRSSEEQECSSLFIEPLKWMSSVEGGALEGKLSCSHCDARLGYFNWSGIQCSCSSWITPAFQIHKNKVDISST